MGGGDVWSGFIGTNLLFLWDLALDFVRCDSHLCSQEMRSLSLIRAYAKSGVLYNRSIAVASAVTSSLPPF